MEDKRNTIDVNEQVSKCESLVELQEILSKNSNYYKDWKQYINRHKADQRMKKTF